MKTLHLSIIIGITLGLSFWCPHFASAHIVTPFSIQPDKNYTDSITHYLSTKEGRPIIVIKQDSEFTLPMTLKSENDSLSTTYSFLVTNDTDFTHKVILPEISIHTVPDHFIIRHGGDQKFDIVIKTGKNAPSGIYTPNLVISWDNNVTLSKEIVGIPFQVGKWNWDSLSKQIESGRSAEHVVCKSSDQIVIIKSEDGSPACVKHDTAKKLVERGWAKEIIPSVTITETTQTGNQTSSDALELLLSTNSTMIKPNQTLGIDITLNNTSSNMLVKDPQNNWSMKVLSMGPCELDPVGIGVYEGNHSLENITDARPLQLYQNGTYECPALTGVDRYVFEPSSDKAILETSNGNSTGEVKYHASFDGFYTKDGFVPPPVGAYTVVADDEWGHLAIQYFTVVNSIKR